jgi:inorganic pyrophosphatase
MRGQGDNDPLDVVELGGRQLAAGSVTRVRALGAFAMIDEGELGARRAVLRWQDRAGARQW